MVDPHRQLDDGRHHLLRQILDGFVHIIILRAETLQVVHQRGEIHTPIHYVGVLLSNRVFKSDVFFSVAKVQFFSLLIHYGRPPLNPRGPWSRV